jgi:hypothetical protein
MKGKINHTKEMEPEPASMYSYCTHATNNKDLKKTDIN